MIDTGAAPNLIKYEKVKADEYIDANSRIFLSGITGDKIKTLGILDAKCLGHRLRFQVVNNNFPIPQDGILGSDFLRDASKIDFLKGTVVWQGLSIPLNQKRTFIPARTRTVLPLRVSNPNVETGFVPRIHVNEDVYLGDAVVTSRDGKAYVGIINTSEKNLKMTIPTVELQEIEAYSTSYPRDAFKPEPTSSFLMGHKSTLPSTHTRLVKMEDLNFDLRARDEKRTVDNYTIQRRDSRPENKRHSTLKSFK